MQLLYRRDAVASLRIRVFPKQDRELAFQAPPSLLHSRTNVKTFYSKGLPKSDLMISFTEWPNWRAEHSSKALPQQSAHVSRAATPSSSRATILSSASREE